MAASLPPLCFGQHCVALAVWVMQPSLGRHHRVAVEGVFGGGLYDSACSGTRQRAVPRVPHADMPCVGPLGSASISLGHTRTGSPRHHIQLQAATGTGAGSRFGRQSPL